jgi:hypothetical protein
MICKDMENYKIGSKVKHKTRGVIETIVGECKVKINDTWVEGIIYEGIDYNTGCLMQFVRIKDDFINNFEPYEFQ